MIATNFLGLLIGTAVFVAAGITAAQPAAPPPAIDGAEAAQPRHSEAYGSYLQLPAQENLMFHDGLDADELIGSQVVTPRGTRIGTVTDLMVGDRGRIDKAALDPGSALGAGSGHVAVEIARLRRTEAGTGILALDMSDEQLRGLPAYRQVGNRWEPLR